MKYIAVALLVCLVGTNITAQTKKKTSRKTKAAATKKKPKLDLTGIDFSGLAVPTFDEYQEMREREKLRAKLGAPEGWVQITRSADEGIYYSPKTVTRNEEYRKVWILVWPTIKAVETSSWRDRIIAQRKEHGLPFKNYSTYFSSKELYQVDCSDKKIRNLAFAVYDVDGNVLDSFDWGYDLDWANIVPETRGEAIADAVCK